MISPVTVLGDEVATDPSATNVSGETAKDNGGTSVGASNTLKEDEVSSPTDGVESTPSETPKIQTYSQDLQRAQAQSATVTSVQLITGIDGNGTETAPFLVSNKADLIKVSRAVSNLDPETGKSGYLYTTNVNNSKVYIKMSETAKSSGIDFYLDYTNIVTFQNNKNEIIIDGVKNTNLSEEQLKSEDNRTTFYFSDKFTGSYPMFEIPGGDSQIGMNITFKNINFGSKIYTAQNWRGFCWIRSGGVTQTVQNISYYGLYGAQPFWQGGTGESSSDSGTLVFKGENHFEVPGNEQEFAQEFAEFQGNMIFDTDSETTIIQKTNNTEALIWNKNDLIIDLKNNAHVNIFSGRQTLFYSSNTPNITINLDGNSYFKFLHDPNYSYTTAQGSTVSGSTKVDYNDLTRSTLNSINFNINSNAKMIFESVDYPLNINLKPLNIKATDTALLEFKNTNSNKAALTGNTLDFKSKTLSGRAYLLDLVGINSANNQTKTIDPAYDTSNVPVFTDVTPPADVGAAFTSTVLNKYKTIIYSPKASFTSVVSTGQSNMQTTPYYSKLTNSLNGVIGDESNYLYKPEYVITNDIKDNSNPRSQSDITNLYNSIAVSSDSADYKTGSITTTDFIEKSKIQPLDLNNLLSGNYQIYAHLAVKSKITNNTYETEWKNVTSAIKPSGYVSYPDSIDLNRDNIISYKTIGNNFGLQFDKNVTFPITNHSNQNLTVKPSSLTKKNSLETNSVNITSSDKELAEKELTLNFNFDSGPIWSLGDLPADNFNLNPLWDTNSTKNFYLDGTYGGPFITKNPAKLDYDLNLDFTWAGSN